MAAHTSDDSAPLCEPAPVEEAALAAGAVLEDPARLEVLREAALLDSEPEAAFDRITALAAQVLRAPVALVSLVDGQRQFFKSQIGLCEPWSLQRQTPHSHSFCKHVVATNQPLVVSDAREHPQLRDNLAIPDLGVVAYAGIPLVTSSGHALGSLCVIDSQPRQWTPEEISILESLAASAMTEIELRLSSARLRQSLERLSQMEQLRQDLTHMLVHDLRTPLASLLAGLAMVPHLGEVNPSQQQAIEAAVRGGRALSGLVNDILDVARMESRTLPLELKPCQASLIVERALQQVEALHASKGLVLSRDIQPGLPPLQADEDKLTRTLVNLLSNAIKFTPRGGRVRVAARLAEGAGSIAFEVHDTGAGIPSDSLERIFDKFGQVESRALGHTPSIGLGLTFCKMAVEAHGGHITVRSEVGRGSDFTFSIPLRRPSPST